MRRRYDDFGGYRGYPAPLPGGGWYPGLFWGAFPYGGWGEWGWYPGPYIPPGRAPSGYGQEYARRPEQSPAYGRDGDRALRRWAERYGYDSGYTISPRARRGRRGDSG